MIGLGEISNHNAGKNISKKLNCIHESNTERKGNFYWNEIGMRESNMDCGRNKERAYASFMLSSC